MSSQLDELFCDIFEKAVTFINGLTSWKGSVFFSGFFYLLPERRHILTYSGSALHLYTSHFFLGLIQSNSVDFKVD